MKLIYVSDSRLPTEKAHGFTQCKMCEALGRLGLDVEMWHPRRKTWIEESVWEWYGLDRVFELKEFWWPDTTRKWSRIVRMVWMCANVPEGQVVMTRNHLALKVLTRMGRPVLFEKHSPTEFTHKNIIGIYDATELGTPVDPEEIARYSCEQASQTLVLGYVGNPTCQGADKGLGLMNEVARRLGLQGTVVCNLPRREAIKEMKGFTVGFVGPYTRGTHRGSGKAHPVKLLEYMTAGVPVVADRASVWPRPKHVFWTDGTVGDYVRQTRNALNVSAEWLSEAKKEARRWTWEDAGRVVIGFTGEFTRFGGNRRCDMFALLLTVSLVLLFIVLVWLIT